MDLNSALGLVYNNAKAASEDSFLTFLLKCQVSGEASFEMLEKLNSELMEALEIINNERRSNGFDCTELGLVQAITLILTHGWERYAWWTIHSQLPREFLVRLASILSDLGFAWARILDGSTPNLREALKERREP